LLKKCTNQSITLSQKQISALLANAFFCTFPKRNAFGGGKKHEFANYPTINFNRLFALTNEPNQLEKLKCIFNYFRRRIDENCGQSLVTFQRRFIPMSRMPQWGKSRKKLPHLRVSASGTIEDEGQGMLEVLKLFL
jgi:poly(ADP-ribose) glycohydrolase